ncbi:MAG: hypothetical protein PHE53_13950, partial [Thermoguttaceae bacterium]|nr:hypothetical protein [Thermoguttaceae bacterium]
MPKENIADFRLTDLDRKIWSEELERFVPRRIFDTHTHLWSNAFTTSKTVSNNDWLERQTDFEELRNLLQALYPRRRVDVLTFALPVIGVDYDRMNRWVATELKSAPNSRGAMLVTPETPPATIKTMVKECGFAAIKVYHHYATAGSVGVSGYFTPAQMEIADELKLAVVLHCRNG